MRHIFPILLFTLAASAQSGPSPEFPIDAPTRTRVITKTANNIERYYFNETLAKQMAAAIRTKQSSGGYDGITGGNQLSAALVADMRAVSRDGHIGMFASAAPLPVFDPDAPPPPPSEQQIQQLRLLSKKTNGFVTDAVWLPGNIGFLSLDAFSDPDSMKQQLGHAMNLLANTDALLIDMRTNHGGAPGGVAVLASYFFDETPVRLNEIVAPRENKRTEYWTLRDLDGARYGPTKPVYILVSKQTFSAPEELAYDLQAMKRAVIVGEQTGGGANPASGVPVDEHFGMLIPRAEARNPYTGTNWEGVGVRPDVRASAASAKDGAYLLALLDVRNLPDTPPFVKDQIETAIQKLLSRLGPEEVAAMAQGDTPAQMQLRSAAK